MPSSSQNNNNNSSSFSRAWTRALQSFTKPLLKPFLALSHHAATYPKSYIVITILLSISLMGVGIMTNFTSDTSDAIWTPQGSRPVGHGEWIVDDSNFPVDSRTVVLVVHRDGQSLFGDDNSLTIESGARMFEALETVRQTPRYDELCSFSNYITPGADSSGNNTCQIVAATSYWNDDLSTFEASATTNQQVLTTMSADTFPSGGNVDHDQIIGYNEFNDAGLLSDGQSYVMVIFLPADKEDDETSEAFSKDFEEDIIDRILELQDEWAEASDNNGFKVEIITDRSFEDEFGRAVTQDLTLIPIVFLLMSLLCVILFARCNSVMSRSLLGFGAVTTVLLAIIASFGMLFAIGVPFTSLTPLLPFILFGVGLDDAFIIYGAYARTDPRKTPVERIDDTMEDIGGTILLTTLTSTLAFGLGAISSIPAVQYLVMYAFPTIMVDYLFQITFFVALIVIDQRRIEDNRRDCCICIKGTQEQDLPASDDILSEDTAMKQEVHFADRLMGRYANMLLNPAVKWLVIAAFAAMFGFFTWRTSELKQFFDFTEVIPSDSYIQGWFDAYDGYYESNGIRAGVYFRDVDFSDPDIRDQMEQYVTELAAMPYAGENEPFSFWLRDFNEFVDSGDSSVLSTLSFEEQIHIKWGRDKLSKRCGECSYNSTIQSCSGFPTS